MSFKIDKIGGTRITAIKPSAFVVFGVNLEGPYVHFCDINGTFTKLLKTPTEDFLMKLAISCVSTLGFGQEYVQGVMELPSFGISGHRLILIAVDNTNLTIDDHNDHIDYFQIAMYIPNDVMMQLRTMITIEPEIMDYFKDLNPCIKEIDSTGFKKIKKDLLNILSTILE